MCPEGARSMGMRTGTMAAVVFVAALCILVPVPFHSHAAAAAVPVLDAEIAEGEYAHSASFSSGAFNLLWQVEGDLAFFAMVARTGGYLGVGFEPELMMKDADMVVGWVEANGSAFVHDSYSMDSFGPVFMDLDLGGTDDLLGFSGQMRDGVVTIEFCRPLSTDDAYDNDIPREGKTKVIWAVGSELDPASLPSNAGVGVIDMTSGGTESAWDASTFYVPGLALALGLALASALMVHRSGRAHSIMGATSALSLLGTGLPALIFSPGTSAFGPWGIIAPLALLLAAAAMGGLAWLGAWNRRWERAHLWMALAALACLALALLTALSI